MNYIEQLQRIFVNINDWLKFAEAKNFGLLTFNSALCFGLSKFGTLDLTTYPSFWILVALLLPSSIICLISIMPVLNPFNIESYPFSLINNVSEVLKAELKVEDQKRNLYFYGHLYDLNQEEFIDMIGINKLFLSKIEKDLIGQILINSKITWQKYVCFKVGSYLTLIGIGAALLSLPIINLIKLLLKCY